MDVEALNRRVGQLRRALAMNLRRCYRACFHEADGKSLTLEGNRVLADLRAFAKMDEHAFRRDAQFRLDPLALARIEGRREVVLRLQSILKLDDQAIQQLVEIKDA